MEKIDKGLQKRLSEYFNPNFIHYKISTYEKHNKV
jgi:hypothetical protein